MIKKFDVTINKTVKNGYETYTRGVMTLGEIGNQFDRFGRFDLKAKLDNMPVAPPSGADAWDDAAFPPGAYELQRLHDSVLFIRVADDTPVGIPGAPRAKLVLITD